MQQEAYKIVINLKNEKIHPDSINLSRERRILAETIKMWNKHTNTNCFDWSLTKADFSVIYRHLTENDFVEPCVQIVCYKTDRTVSTKEFRDTLICLLKDIKQEFSILSTISLEEFFVSIINI